MDPFVIVQWVLRALLALVFAGTGIVCLVPTVRARLTALVPERFASASGRAGAIVAGVGVTWIVLGLALLAPWWGLRFTAAILLIALVVAVNLSTIAATKRRPGASRLVAQLVLVLATIVAVI